MGSTSRLFARIWEDRLRWELWLHPRRDHVVNAIIANQLTTREIDLVFLEAEYEGWRWLLGEKS
ncbi:hypothetical protein EF847_01495 [Actinobacteria bacterium YIM 96077]|uniref:Uncharacterized protein n=1 Tax=Phytoactinopolyspora halophila TaxID=1981511 RepID=A0A329QGR3_9ACTN|nr:hypothetical protein [Phytoactinopolyspora halophila]AYY11595.1 hypothetical protein EF847_01495 [Actinobacteria bacterium YIM 96077]RAW11141.1 hypothetical protein DPM12_17520 [Phytoactinopolyspora halophila]